MQPDPSLQTRQDKDLTICSKGMPTLRQVRDSSDLLKMRESSEDFVAKDHSKLQQHKFLRVALIWKTFPHQCKMCAMFQVM